MDRTVVVPVAEQRPGVSRPNAKCSGGAAAGVPPGRHDKGHQRIRGVLHRASQVDQRGRNAPSHTIHQHKFAIAYRKHRLSDSSPGGFTVSMICFCLRGVLLPKNWVVQRNYVSAWIDYQTQFEHRHSNKTFVSANNVPFCLFVASPSNAMHPRLRTKIPASEPPSDPTGGID